MTPKRLPAQIGHRTTGASLSTDNRSGAGFIVQIFSVEGTDRG
jgi:hypothetical protein